MAPQGGVESARSFKRGIYVLASTHFATKANKKHLNYEFEQSDDVSFLPSFISNCDIFYPANH